MTKAIRVHNTGGPEVMTLEDVEIGQPSAEEVRVRHTAIGLNFIDVYHRTGAYPLPELPSSIGLEAAGVVEEVGDGVTDLAVGDRVEAGEVIAELDARPSPVLRAHDHALVPAVLEIEQYSAVCA